MFSKLKMGALVAALGLLSQTAVADASNQSAELLPWQSVIQAWVQALTQADNRAGLHVGDTDVYAMKMMGQEMGSMTESVKSINGTEVVINQTIAVFGMNQSCDVTLNAATGKIKSMVCNGQAQQVPETQEKIVETKKDKVTVPAGTFDCDYVKMQDDKGQVSENWINSNEVPIGGLLKTLANSQMGQIELDLKSFQKGT